MGGCTSKPMELEGEMNACLIQDEHGEKEEGKDMVKEAAGGQNDRQSLGFFLKELEAKEAEESNAEHLVEGSENKDSMEDVMIVPETEDMELPVSSLVNAS